MTTKSERTAGLVPKVTCIANRSNGQPCSNRPMKGQNVCKNHGGAAPQARAKAAERILLAQDLAAAKLVELMRDPSVPPGVQRMAAADLLDRGGNVAAHVLAIPGLGNEEPWQVVFSGMAGGSRAESRALRGIEDDNAGVLDAEIVALDAEDAPLAMLDGVGNGSAAVNRPGSDGDLVQATSRSEVAVEH
ncbi:HGGxSTG domain-containing protein [Rhodococcus sp. EPR-157]|uniref:HGGxSTG domain-containing protein n=1 Tax=Rhodococcus sp. EPR-157 TaxID=1813677 RepID=UPI000A86AFC7|nr:HGGxSTG domain-containing protein [Rhodococcus sp. EPR-157]